MQGCQTVRTAWSKRKNGHFEDSLQLDRHHAFLGRCPSVLIEPGGGNVMITLSCALPRAFGGALQFVAGTQQGFERPVKRQQGLP